MHTLNSPQSRQLIEDLSSGTTRKRISRRNLGKIDYPIPPLNEQRRIVAKIDALQAHSRRAREALDALPALLERFRQSVLASAFRGDLTADWRAQNPDVEPASVLLDRIRAERKVRWIEAAAEKARARAEAKAHKAGKPWAEADDEKVTARERVKAQKKYKEPEPVDAEKEGLPELPEGWCWATLDTLVASVSYGYTASSNLEPIGPKFLRITDLTSKGVDWATVPHCSQPGTRQYELKGGDIVVARTGATTGKSYLINDPPTGAVYASYLIKLDTLASFPASFLAFFMKGPSYWEQIMVVSKGSAQPGANATILGGLHVPVPPAVEMREMQLLITTRLRAVSLLSKPVEDATSRLGSLDQSILAKAFRGELVPQDPADEPASVLLERIKAEREAQAASKQRRGRRRPRTQ